MKASLIASDEDTQPGAGWALNARFRRCSASARAAQEQVAVSETAREVAPRHEQLHADPRMRARPGQLVSPVVMRGRIERHEVPAARALMRHVRPAHLEPSACSRRAYAPAER